MAPLRALLSYLLPLHCALCAAAGSRTPELHLSGKLSDYGVTVPCSTDFRGRFLSHVVSGPAAASAGSMVVDTPPTLPRHSSHLRVARSPLHPGGTLWPGRVGRHSLYFNVTVFGKELHLRLRPNRRLVVPGSSVEWQEDFRELFRQPLRQECVYTGGVTGMPGAAVAISNCDGLAGLIRTDSTDFFIEPLERGQQEKEASGRTHVVYRREAVQQEWAEPDGDLHNEAFGLGDLPNLLGLVGDQLGDTERKRRHAKPGSYSIEVLLVVDDSVVRFHGKEHVQNYVLTLMNIVDEIYHDESLGVHINIALVRLIMVGYRQSLSLIERGNPSRSLEQVCRWAHSQQRQDPSHAEHHDHVVFLTRQDFGPSGMQGYAPVTGMCHPLRSCALNHEDGFSSAFVIAHETGHVLGMEHDGQGNGCADETSLGSVMAPLVQAAFHRFHWSRCSKLELSRYLPSYDCLLDDPFDPAWPQPPELPGINYSMDEQCRFDFGSGYQTCLAFRTFEPCKQLWCSHPDNPYFCKTKKGPPLDGTECAPGKWCFKGHCIWKSPEQTYGQDGGWSSWTKFGSCSRSCGGGVRSRSRSCNNPSPAYGGRLCLGPMFEYQVCNSEECPGTYEDFRAQQCAKRNSYYVHQNAKHSWVPYEPDDDAQKCELICQSADTGDVVFMNQVVHDGTRCSYRDPYSVCARGECVPVGCDKEVGSMKADDKCGVCGGDNSHCRTVKGTLGKASKQAGALKLVQIPAGARHIQIEALEKSPHRIVVKNQVTGSFILNPKGKEATSRTFTAMGLEWEDAVEDAKESLKTSGPLPEAIAILCSATCGEGIQQRQVVCRTNANSLGHCEGDRPDTVQVCSLPACGGNHQNSTVRADVWELGTPEGQWVPQSEPLHPINKISSTEPCTGDRSVFCQMEVLDRYCSIPGYHRLCCVSCIKKASGPNPGPDPGPTSLPPFSTPGSPLPGPQDPADAAEPPGKPTGSEDHQHGRATQLPGALDTSSPGTQHPFAPETPIPGASWSISPTTPGGLPWGWTQTPTPVPEDKGQPGEDLRHPGTSLPAASPVT
ncbi:A disintegrin and metalloproteinase with thrombospondin motifs 14 isoform X1 [Homo sapiens]|uniref:A disintegrin and metalloproteinase with thrombospondin motifs 14 isoform X1 n=1 Tax=Homo sapiens TaxID=9606 RepID=UPI0005D02A7B|nr:A disintegrin and metalloproteinase with thrombospondin motifs 14 isoform X1 [Homo sapiens]|eukprot:XP_011537602.1 A disintegrin and metalloproteinase with thrombospondin motifs 14 isoform X1 [Homo sapiens]